ncbi:hypothetical protein Cni_G14414 [Canna indica]|uniref:Uncharacterized protein n=1 Tax=Canna indica TaxID=4628 RepID=A0AAQ3QER3_9LILI|nr:hypothetical protein Cni_G14414 [Canna indica]
MLGATMGMMEGAFLPRRLCSLAPVGLRREAVDRALRQGAVFFNRCRVLLAYPEAHFRPPPLRRGRTTLLSLLWNRWIMPGGPPRLDMRSPFLVAGSPSLH